jgi:ribosomal protein L11 methyltransferase
MSPDGALVVIPPGSAFGDGSHATTRMSLEMLEQEISGGERVLDLGTGSGILAIAAAKLGARKVIATDIDRDACEVARENIRLNHVEGRVLVFHGSVEAIHQNYRFDVAVANFYNADQIKAALPEMARRVKVQGRVVCAGIWVRRAEEMIRLLTREKFRVRNLLTQDAFVTISAVKERE